MLSTLNIDADMYWHFYGAVAAYVALTVMIILSFGPIRAKHYELFYMSHMVLGVIFLVGCLVHFPLRKGYIIIALGIWGGERFTRLIWWFYINGYFHGLNSSEKQSAKLTKLHNKIVRIREKPSMTPSHSPASPAKAFSEKPQLPGIIKGRRKGPPAPLMLYQVDSPTNFGSPSSWEKVQSPAYPPISPTSQMSFSFTQSKVMRPTPPPGFALAQLLPGRNIRLTIRVPRIVHWRTGQYSSLTIPSVSKLQGHPFTIANADERKIREVDAVGSEVVLIVGVRNGFTKALWDEIVSRRKIFGPAAAASSGGILIRAQIGLPTGTAGRANLDDFSSVLIVCGGTGISFGMSVLEHVCMSMHERDTNKTNAAKGKKCLTKRVRIVWVLREFGQSSPSPLVVALKRLI